MSQGKLASDWDHTASYWQSLLMIANAFNDKSTEEVPTIYELNPYRGGMQKSDEPVIGDAAAEKFMANVDRARSAHPEKFEQILNNLMQTYKQELNQ